jgi:hypothetical protein
MGATAGSAIIMSGDALTTHRSDIIDFGDQLIGGDLKRGDAKPDQRRQKFRPRDAGDFGRFGLRDLLGLIPLNSGSQAHFAQKCLRFLAKSRKDVLGQF